MVYRPHSVYLAVRRPNEAAWHLVGYPEQHDAQHVADAINKRNPDCETLVLTCAAARVLRADATAMSWAT
jgi:hypothetical protein